MSSPAAQTLSNTNRTVILTRLFDAPRALVFKAWTTADMVQKWWGPGEYPVAHCTMDARPGGVFYIEMRGPDGNPFPEKGMFSEVVPPEKLVFNSGAFLDAQGNPQVETLNVVTFEDADGKTKLTLHATVTKLAPGFPFVLEPMEAGWNEGLDQLAQLLAQQ
jgi:uncharacterized protein YndB with AHSA1/START domain